MARRALSSMLSVLRIHLVFEESILWRFLHRKRDMPLYSLRSSSNQPLLPFDMASCIHDVKNLGGPSSDMFPVQV